MRRPTTERQLLVSRIKALAEALEGSEVSELDLTEGGTRILIRRRLETEAPPVARTPSARGARPRRPRPEQAASGTAPDPGVAIIAPLTGVFYASPSPSS